MQNVKLFLMHAGKLYLLTPSILSSDKVAKHIHKYKYIHMHKLISCAIGKCSERRSAGIRSESTGRPTCPCLYPFALEGIAIKLYIHSMYTQRWYNQCIHV